MACEISKLSVNKPAHLREYRHYAALINILLPDSNKLHQ